MKKFIKKHKYTAILLLFFILIVILGIKVKQVLVPDEGKATYGERLKDIDNYPISDEIYDKVKEEYENDEKIKKITHRLQGRILNYYITVDDKVVIKDAKAMGEKLLTYFSEETLSYYSVQIFIMKDDEALNDFPIIGLKDPLSKSISWTKDREIVMASEESVGDLDEE